MKVWLVFKDYPYEGSTFFGVYDSLEKANTAVKVKAHEDFEWEFEQDKVKFKEHPDGTTSYEAYDYIYCEEHEVE